MNKIGLECKLYRNGATYAAPSWLEVENVKDVSFPKSAAEADVTTRKSMGWKEYLTTLLDASLDFTMVYDTEDVDFTTIEDAFYGKSAVEFLVLDGPVTTPGTQGVRFTGGVTKFDEKQPLTEASTVDVTIKPRRAEHAPEKYIVASS